MTTEIINYQDSKVIETLKNTVAVGATDAEFEMFAGLCKASGLNPFKREVWFIKAGGRAQIMTGINGFFAIANNHPSFDGHESGLIDADGNFVTTAYPKNYIGAWCKVYRKDRRIPTEGVAMLEDYDKQQSNWKTMKRVMIVKCAESVALRKTFPQEMNGLYTAEEMPLEYNKPKSKDPLEGDWHELNNKPKPVPRNELETYVVQYSPDFADNGLMLCEIDPEFFENLTSEKAKIFDERDLVNIREYYKHFIHKSYRTKAEQAEKLAAKREVENVTN